MQAKEKKLELLDDQDKRVLVMCGMSAAFSALFGTPVAAAIFAKLIQYANKILKTPTTSPVMNEKKDHFKNIRKLPMILLK